MSGASRYLVCEGREIHYTEWGATWTTSRRTLRNAFA